MDGDGIETDYEETESPNLEGRQAFIGAFREALPYYPTGEDRVRRLTIDLAAGDRWLIGITRKATSDWLNPANPVLDYANAMVPARQPRKAGADTTPGMLGYMFWAAECQGSRAECTTPPNSCEGGAGVGAETYGVPVPMPALRQK